MIVDSNGSRSILDFKDRELTELTLEERVEFSKSNDFPEPGVSVLDLLAIQKAMDTMGSKSLQILETGMCFGTTTRFFLLHILKYGGDLHTVEFKIRTDFAVKMDQMGLWKDPHFHVHEEDTRYMYWDPKDRINFLFIDSEHGLSDALGEYMRFRMFLEQGALIGFHDSQCCYGVKKAIAIAKEVDVLEEVASNRLNVEAGVEIFRIIRRDRNDPNYKAEE